MLTPDELAAIEARANAASDGPWEPLGRNPGHHKTEIGAMLDTPRAIVIADTELWGRQPTDQNGADAAFIASARTDVPKLLAEVQRLQAVERIAVEALNTIASDNCDACGPGVRDLAHARTLADDALTRMDGVE